MWRASASAEAASRKGAIRIRRRTVKARRSAIEAAISSLSGEPNAGARGSVLAAAYRTHLAALSDVETSKHDDAAWRDLHRTALHAERDAIQRLRHGDEIDDPAAKLDQYLAHRLERERKLLAALESGIAADDEDALLDAAWPDAAAAVRPFAAITLRAHLAKLQQEGNLGV